jgi:hypothetical protein
VVIELPPMLGTALSAAANPPIDWKHSQPGFTALIVVGVLVVAVGFLWRSMLKHVRKAKEPWEGDEGA